MPPNTPDNFKKRFTLLLSGIVIVVVALIAYSIYSASKFHVVSTNPSTRNVAAVAPFFKVTFNKPLSSNGVSVSASLPIIKAYKVNGSTLDITLDTPMKLNQAYVITIQSVSDTNGHHITNKKISFVTKDIPPESLPQDQRQALLQLQLNRPASNHRISYGGTDAFLNYGVTTAQKNGLEQAFYQFNKNALEVVVDVNSISPVPHDRFSASTTDTINFKVSVDGTTYKAKLEYSNLTASRLYLYNPQTGAPVFESNVINS